jgi:hypothetical protein
MSWRFGLSDRAPTVQVQSPEFKPQSHQKERNFKDHPNQKQIKQFVRDLGAYLPPSTHLPLKSSYWVRGNPTYLGSIDRRQKSGGSRFKASRGTQSERKNSSQERAGGMAQGVSPDFRPKYWDKKNPLFPASHLLTFTFS